VRLIRAIPPVFPGELRYYITDDRLVSFITIIRQIQGINFQKINAKLTYFEQPDEYDRQFLELFFGKKATNLAIARAHQIRKDLKNKSNNRAEIRRIKQVIKTFDDYIYKLTIELVKNYGSYLKSNELLTDLTISFPNIYSS
jgi:hypothetical protein